MILAHQLASSPDPFGQNLTRSARNQPDPFGQNLTRSIWPKPDTVSQKPTRSIWLKSHQIYLAQTWHSQPETNRIHSAQTWHSQPETNRNHLAKIWPDLFGPNLTQSARNQQIHLAKTWHSQPEPNWIQAGFAQNDPGHLLKKATESDSGKLAAALCSARNQARWFFLLHASLLLDRCLYPKPDQAIQIDLDQFCTTWSMPSLEKQNQTGCGKSDQAYTIWPDFGHDGHNCL